MKTLVIILVSTVVNSYNEQPPVTVKDSVHHIKEIKLEVKHEKDPLLKKL